MGSVWCAKYAGGDVMRLWVCTVCKYRFEQKCEKHTVDVNTGVIGSRGGFFQGTRRFQYVLSKYRKV